MNLKFLGIIGEPGSGKTNLLAHYLSKYNEDGWPIAANFGLKIPYIAKGFNELATLPDDLNGAFVGVDELGVGADSYEFNSSNSKQITTLVAEIRKRHCIVAYTVQYFHWIAVRLRVMTGGFILMDDLDKHITHCPHFSRPETCPGLPSCAGYICEGLFKRVFLDGEGEFIGEDVFDGNPYWNLYDTSEIVLPDS